MFEIDGKTYELKYNLKRIEMIENATGSPTMAEMQKNKGMLGISQLKTYVALVFDLKSNAPTPLWTLKRA